METGNIGDVIVDRLGYVSDIDVVPSTPIGSQICVMNARHGHLDIRSDGGLTPLEPGTSVALDEARLFAMRWYPEAWCVNLRMPVATVRRCANELSGEITDNARFTFANPPDEDRQQRWEQVMIFAENMVATPPAVNEDSLWIAEFERFMVMSLLLTHPNTVMKPELRPRDERVSSVSARQAAELMAVECEQPLSVAEIAARVGVGVRTLQVGFQQVYGTTPRAYLRELRLQRAHAELISNPDVTIASVAYRWGFSTPSRFATHHRRHFGVHPAELQVRYRRGGRSRRDHGDRGSAAR